MVLPPLIRRALEEGVRYHPEMGNRVLTTVGEA